MEYFAEIRFSAMVFWKYILWFLSHELKLYALGAFILGWGMYEFALQEFSVRSWVSTQGMVIDSRTERRQSDDRTTTHYYVHVKYEYEANGRQFVSDRMTTGDRKFYYLLDEARKARLRYSPGQQVEVWHAPYDPTQSALIVERGGNWKLGVFLGLPILLVTGLWHWWRLRQSDEVELVPPMPISFP